MIFTNLLIYSVFSSVSLAVTVTLSLQKSNVLSRYWPQIPKTTLILHCMTCSLAQQLASYLTVRSCGLEITTVTLIPDLKTWQLMLYFKAPLRNFYMNNK